MSFALSRQACFALAAALLALVMYGLCLPDSITGEDAGELTVAAYFLGIPHPPGYPTWCLAAHPFTWIPLGSVAWRVALSSAVFGAAAVGLTSLLVSRMTKQVWPGFIAGMLFAVSKPMFTQCVVAEVYALNALCMVGCVYLLFLWEEDRRDSRLLWVALILGLGQGVHNTMTILAPIFAAYALWRAPSLRGRYRFIAKAFGLFLLGFSTFLYLPIRSLADPPIDWGNPETWENFKAVVGRDQFAFMYSQYPRSLAIFAGQLWSIAKEIESKSWIPLWLILIGLFNLQIRLKLMSWLVVVALFPLLVITWLQNPRMETAEWIAVMAQFYIPAVWLVAILAVTTFPMHEVRVYPKLYYTLCGLMLVWLSLAAIGSMFPYLKGYAKNWAEPYARLQLDQMEPNALLFAGPDHLAFPFIYLQSVLGMRKDVTLGNPYGYVDTQLVSEAPPELREKLGTAPRRSLEPDYLGWLLLHTERPVYFSERPSLPPGTPIAFRQEGLLYRALRTDQASPPDLAPRWPDAYVDCYAIQRAFTYGFAPDAIFAELHAKRAEYDFALGNTEGAVNDVLRAVERANRDPQRLNNIAATLARNGIYDSAIPTFERALALEPDNPSIQRNLERARAKAAAAAAPTH